MHMQARICRLSLPPAVSGLHIRPRLPARLRVQERRLLQRHQRQMHVCTRILGPKVREEMSGRILRTPLPIQVQLQKRCQVKSSQFFFTPRRACSAWCQGTHILFLFYIAQSKAIKHTPVPTANTSAMGKFHHLNFAPQIAILLTAKCTRREITIHPGT